MTASNLLERDRSVSAVRRVLPGETCDRCCAPACVYVVVRSGLDLVFCSHHAREHELKLRRSGALLHVDGRLASMYW